MIKGQVSCPRRRAARGLRCRRLTEPGNPRHPQRQTPPALHHPGGMPAISRGLSRQRAPPPEYPSKRPRPRQGSQSSIKGLVLYHPQTSSTKLRCTTTIIIPRGKNNCRCTLRYGKHQKSNWSTVGLWFSNPAERGLWHPPQKAKYRALCHDSTRRTSPIDDGLERRAGESRSVQKANSYQFN